MIDAADIADTNIELGAKYLALKTDYANLERRYNLLFELYCDAITDPKDESATDGEAG